MTANSPNCASVASTGSSVVISPPADRSAGATAGRTAVRLCPAAWSLCSGRRRLRVVEAFMLIQTEVGRAEVIAKQLAELPGVLSAEYVTGPYDVVVRIG